MIKLQTNSSIKKIVPIWLLSVLMVFPSTFAQTSTLAASENKARGVVEAVSRATLASNISSPIQRLGFRRGQNFKKGETLVEFFCAGEKAVRDAAKAVYDAAKQNYEKNRELLSYEAAGKFDVAIAKAEMNQASAEYEEQKIFVKQCKITAPFDGAVVATLVNAHETPQARQPLIEIINTEQFEIILIAPSSWLQWLTTGETFNFTLDDTGKTIEGVVNRIGPVIDPVSQTIEIIGVVNISDTSLRHGMGGEANFMRGFRG